MILDGNANTRNDIEGKNNMPCSKEKKKKEGQSARIRDYLWEVVYVGLGWECNLMEGY